MLSGLLLAILIIVSIALTAVILLQRSEGGALGVGGGGGGFMTARGTGDLLTRSTSVLAALFFAICIALVFIGGERRSGTVTDRISIEDIDPTARPAQAPTPSATGGAVAPTPASGGLPATGLPSLEAPSPVLTPAPAPTAPAPAAQTPAAPQ